MAATSTASGDPVAPDAARRPPRRPSSGVSRLPLWLSAAALAVVATVTVVRVFQAGEGELLTARSERLFYDWAAGDAEIDRRLAAAAPRLPPGAGVRLVVPARVDAGWATFRGLYRMPQQRVIGVHRPTEPPPPRDAWIVDLTVDPPRVTPPTAPPR